MIDIRSDPEIAELLERCYNDTKVFAQFFFPEYFYRPFSTLHDEIFRLIDDPKEQRIAIAAPRGFGKTSIINMAVPAKSILFQDKRFIVPISASADAAVEQAENLKDELTSNDLIATFFGKMESWKWSEKQWITSNGCKILPRGAGQQIRGRRYKKDRPDLIIVDDLEDDEAVESEDQRRKLKRWFFSSVCNSIARDSKDWKIIVIGTILHEDSLLQNLLDDSEWTSIRLDLCDDNYNSNWEDFISTAEVNKMVVAARERGELGIFYREYRNIVIPAEQAGFRPEYFKAYMETEEELNRDPDIESIVMADPAKTHTEGSANTAVVGVSINTKTMKVYVRDVVEKQMFPNELYDEMIDMADRIKAHVLGPEVTSLNEYIMYPLQQAMMARRKFYEIVEVKPRDKKASRAAALIPLYRTGMVLHNPACCGRLESSLLSFPRPKKWDVIDCLSNLTYVLEYGDRYFTGVHEDTPEAIEEEYAELEQELEPALDDRWKRV
jgi:hypothetical protein